MTAKRLSAGGLLLLLLSAALVWALPRGKAVARQDARPARLLPTTPVATTPAQTAKAPPAQDRPSPEVGMAPAALRQQGPAEARPAATAAVEVVVRSPLGRTEEELLEEAGAAPSLALDRGPERDESTAVVEAAKDTLAAGGTSHATLALVERRRDLAGLPLRRGEACRLTPEAAAHLDECSRALRGLARDADTLHKGLTAGEAKLNKWLLPESVPVLMQMLMAEAAPVREVLAGHLSRIEGWRATEALTQLALFDLHPRVRARAVAALATRPAAGYRAALLAGFEHPWPAVAEHAADALVALKRKEAAPDLVRVLAAADPRAPYRKAGRDVSFVKELVRVNHLRNCLLCHPPSFSPEDKVRAQVPATDQQRDSPPTTYYGGQQLIRRKNKLRGTFVRADVTYLKQDFSAMLPADVPGRRPAVQRFDFFVRERLATERDHLEADARRKAGPCEQHQSALFALRELTGR